MVYRTLKAGLGKEIGITGSISVVRDLIAAGLVDEYRLFVFPVVLGRGERLFADAKTTGSGVVVTTYRATCEKEQEHG